MIFSPNYLRLLTFMAAARNNRGLDAWEKDHQTTLDGFDDAIARLTSFRDGHGFTGEAATAMNAWVDSSISRIQAYKASYENGYNAYDTGRQVMQAALAEAETLSPNLLDEKTAAMRDDWFVVIPESEPGGGFTGLGQRFTSGEAYVEAVEAQANAQREAAAQRILDELNAHTTSINKDMKDETALSERDLQRASSMKDLDPIPQAVTEPGCRGAVPLRTVMVAGPGATVRRASIRVVLISRGGVRRTRRRRTTALFLRGLCPPRSRLTVSRGRARIRSRTRRTLWTRTCCTRA